jgi:hypothetical protein
MRNPHGMSLERLVRDEVQRLNHGVSSKFVPQPTHRQVLGDALVGLGRFKNAVRWRYFWTERNSQSQSVAPSLTSSDEPSDASSASTVDNDVSVAHLGKDNIGGLGTGLRPPKAKQAPQASAEVEAFLREVDRAVLSNVAATPTVDLTRIDTTIVSLEKALEKVPVVVVPTDKTNSFRVISTEDYTRFMNEHLATSSVEVPRKRILEIHLQAQQEFECLLNDGLLNENELRFIEEN